MNIYIKVTFWRFQETNWAWLMDLPRGSSLC